MVLLDDGIKRITGNGWCLRIHKQTRALQGDMILIVRQCIFILQILLMLTFPDLVEWWLGNKYMPPLYQFPHLAEEEGEQQGANVRTVHVSVSHDNDAVVT